MLVQFVKAVSNLFCGLCSQHTTVSEVNQQQPQPQFQYPPQPAQVPVQPPKKHQQDSNQNEYYLSLRAQAKEHGDKMRTCLQESHEAHNYRNRERARQLSNEHQKKMEEFNNQASDWIFRENNKDRAPGEVDLHGLYLNEAVSRAEEAITNAQRQGRSELRFIVGRGVHSPGGVPKIKPEIQRLTQRLRLKAELDPQNPGVLVVELQARSR